MKKLILIFTVVSLFLIIGCSKSESSTGQVVESVDTINEVDDKKTCTEKEVKYTEDEVVTTEVCDDVDYSLTVIKSKIDAIPSEAKWEYDIGTITVSLLNKDSKVSGDFVISVECVTSESYNIKDKGTINVQPGSIKKLTLRCDGKNHPKITLINDPIVESAPRKGCKEITETKQIEKTKIEEVCE